MLLFITRETPKNLQKSRPQITELRIERNKQKNNMKMLLKPLFKLASIGTYFFQRNITYNASRPISDIQNSTKRKQKQKKTLTIRVWNHDAIFIISAFFTCNRNIMSHGPYQICQQQQSSGFTHTNKNYNNGIFTTYNHNSSMRLIQAGFDEQPTLLHIEN